jgi:adenosylmethionine-8-amino-7-oxononanoate aminotransferase
MEKIIKNHHGEIAAVIIEPLCQCAAGMRIYPPAYLKQLSQLCRTLKILLIADEIAVGFGRTGTMFAFEQAGIEPDIICLGKGLAGGYLPISATVVKENIYATFSDVPRDNTFYHGHTFAGNPIACAAALEVLKIYEEENIVLQARQKGALMKKKMGELQALNGVKNVRGLGMIGAFDLRTEMVKAVRQKLLKQGILLRPLGNTLYLMPPLITPDRLLSKTIDLLAEILSTTM